MSIGSENDSLASAGPGRFLPGGVAGRVLPMSLHSPKPVPA